MPTPRQCNRLTDFQKGQIDALRPYFSHHEIASQLGIPRRTVSSFLKRLDERESIENIPPPGRPRKTSISDDRYIVHTAELETRVPLTELRQDVGLNLCEQTIRRRLREAGIRKWKAVKRALLTQRHAINRLKWAREHRHWTVDDWRKVAWSDECAVQKDSDPIQLRVFRRQTKDEKYAPKNIQGKSRDGDVSQMIWASFMGNKLGPIVFLNGSVNADVYISVLKETLVPFIDAISADGLTNVIFQQDNARPHTAKKTREFLGAAAREHGFSVMDWPANSPDMNLIEQLWAHLKLELHRRYPDTKHIHGSPDYVRGVLRERLIEIWWSIGEEVLNTLVESMPRRIRALIAAGGWYTEY
jgi:Transposase/DDE superfamily endonuclease